MLSPTAALTALGGLARTATLLAHGVTERELTGAVRSGAIARVRKGIYATCESAAALHHAAEHGGVPACTDAGRILGLWILTDGEVPHIWLGDGRDRLKSCEGCRRHWEGGTARIGALPPMHTVLLQIARCADEDPFFAAYESALRWSKIPPAGIAWLWKHIPVKLRWLMSIARSDADSGLESVVRLRLHRLGIRVRTQVSIKGVGEVDMVIGRRLIIECDGRENHEREAQRHRDLVRDAAAATRGYETLRFDYAMIVHDWPSAEGAILAKVAAHGIPASRLSDATGRMPATRRAAHRHAATAAERPTHPTPGT